MKNGEHAGGFKDFMLHQLGFSHGILLKLVGDLSEEEAQRSPTGTLSPIVWQIGHSAAIDAFFASLAGRSCAVPAGFAELFGRRTGGVRPYPPLSDVRPVLETVNQALATVVESMDLTEKVVGGPEIFRNRGDVVAFVGVHRGYHMGKIATLRALLGKPRLID